MYQRHEITINKNSAAAVKFYNEQVNSYIDYIENNHYTYKLNDTKYEDYVKFDLVKDENDDFLTIKLDEDWSRIFRNRSSVSEKTAPISDFLDAVGIQFGTLLRAYLSADEETKKAVHFRYAIRTLKDAGSAYAENFVKVFDSDNMSKPIMVRSDPSYYMSLPVNNIITLEELPNCKWYSSLSNFVFFRANEYMNNTEFDESMYTLHELKECDYGRITVDPELLEVIEDNKTYIDEFMAIDEETFCLNDLQDVSNIWVDSYELFLGGIYEKQEMIELAEKVYRFFANTEKVNELVGIKEELINEYLSPSFTMMMFNDNFDAVEVFIDENMELKCRYYENGKTEIFYPEEKPITEPMTDEEYADNKYNSTLQYVEDTNTSECILEYRSAELARFFNDHAPADDFDGEIITDGDLVRIRSKAYHLMTIAELAYHNKRELIGEVFGRFVLPDEESTGVPDRKFLLITYNDGRYQYFEDADTVSFNGFCNFLSSIRDNYDNNVRRIRRLWLGIQHECGKDEFCVPRVIEKIGDVSLHELRELYISADCKSIALDAFESSPKLKKVSILSDSVKFPKGDLFNKNVTIYAHKGSTAENYARENGISFEEIK